MAVRLAKPEDITAALELGRFILERSVIKSKVNDLHARKTMLRCMNDKSMSMWVAEHKGKVVGFLMAIKEQEWYSTDKYATDICFCVHPQHGNYAPTLIRRFRKWAKSDPKVTDIFMAISTGLDKDGRAGRMYQKLGFAPVGGMYRYSEDSNV